MRNYECVYHKVKYHQTSREIVSNLGVESVTGIWGYEWWKGNLRTVTQNNLMQGRYKTNLGRRNVRRRIFKSVFLWRRSLYFSCDSYRGGDGLNRLEKIKKVFFGEQGGSWWLTYYMLGRKKDANNRLCHYENRVPSPLTCLEGNILPPAGLKDPLEGNILARGAAAGLDEGWAWLSSVPVNFACDLGFWVWSADKTPDWRARAIESPQTLQSEIGLEW